MEFLSCKMLCPHRKALRLFFILIAISSFSACDFDPDALEENPACMMLMANQAAIIIALNNEDPEVRKEAEEALQILNRQIAEEGCN